MTFLFSSDSSPPRDRTPQIPPLSPDQEQFLRQQKIDDLTPGSILRDFQMLLDFIGEKGLEVSKNHHFLPLKSLQAINQRLTQPIAIDLKRPQQKSYPSIHGLYLLLRASGLGLVVGRGSKWVLHLDPEILESWNQLNSTERYFNLLETWWIWGNEEILGESRSYFRPTPFSKCAMSYQQIPDKGLKIGKSSEQASYNFYPGLYNLALMQLFGFIEIESGKPESGKGWPIKTIARSPFGDILMQKLLGVQLQMLAAESEEEEEQAWNERQFGLWHAELSPYFSEWKHNLAVPETQFRHGVHFFKVSLSFGYPRTKTIWRRIAIPADGNLEDLSDIILESVSFVNDHLHAFSWKDRYGCETRVYHEYMQEPPFTNSVKIGQLSLHDGQLMTYLFDFGDNWEFDVQLEKVESTDTCKIAKPTILKSYGDAPEQYPMWEDEEDWEEEEEWHEE